jgi:hypothetical protein
MTTTTLLKKTGLALGVALAFAAGSAGANTYALPNTAGTPQVAAVGAGNFTDYFSFTAPSGASGFAADAESIAATFTYFGVPIQLPAVQFSSFTLDTDTNVGNGVLWTATSSPTSSFTAIYSGLLTAGTTYYLGVSGTASAPGGLYGVGVAAVPEPGEWAMMMAGLGLIGVMARRRSVKR